MTIGYMFWIFSLNNSFLYTSRRRLAVITCHEHRPNHVNCDVVFAKVAYYSILDSFVHPLFMSTRWPFSPKNVANIFSAINVCGGQIASHRHVFPLNQSKNTSCSKPNALRVATACWNNNIEQKNR